MSVRGSGSLPYRPGRPLRLPGDGGPRRPPQLNTRGLFRLLIPLLAIAGLGVGVFFGVDALLSDAGPGEAGAVSETPASAESPAEQGAGGAIEAGQAQAETPAGENAAAEPGSETPADETAPADEVPAAPAEEPVAPDILTPADVGGAPLVVDRGAATPVPPGVPDPNLADGSPYDPTDASVALSNTWPVGTVLQLTRLPGGPLLSEEDSAELIGKSIQVTVRGGGEFLTELQLSTAAYQSIARDFEPIIAVRIEVKEAPPE